MDLDTPRHWQRQGKLSSRSEGAIWLASGLSLDARAFPKVWGARDKSAIAERLTWLVSAAKMLNALAKATPSGRIRHYGRHPTADVADWLEEKSGTLVWLTRRAWQLGNSELFSQPLRPYTRTEFPGLMEAIAARAQIVCDQLDEGLTLDADDRPAA